MKSKNFIYFLTLLFLTVLIPGIFAAPPAEPSRGHHRRMERPYPQFLEQLPDAEKNQLKKLFREDPAAFREYARAYWKKKFEAHKQELIAIGKRYHAAADEAAKKQLEQELRTKITTQFDRHLNFTEKQIRSHENRIRQMQERLDRLKAETERKKANKSADVEKAILKVLEISGTPGKAE